MGHVYRGLHLMMEHRVAIKLLHGNGWDELFARDVALPENVTLASEEDMPVVSIAIPRGITAAEAAEAEGEGEEGAEGETAEGGDGSEEEEE